MQKLGRVCRAYGLTPSQYLRDHDLEDFYLDAMVTNEWERAAAEQSMEELQKAVAQIPKKSAETIQAVLLTCLVRMSSK